MEWKKCDDFASLSASLKSAKRPSTLKKDSGNVDITKDEEKSDACTINSPSVGEICDDYPSLSSIHSLPFGKHQSTLTTHTREITSISFASHSCFTSSSADGSISFWDPHKSHCDQPTLQIRVSDDSGIRFAVHSPSGKHILTASRASSLMLLDILTGKLTSVFAKGDRYVMDQRQTKGHTGSIHSAKWSSDGKIVSGGADGTVRLWSIDGVQEKVLVALPRAAHQKPVIGTVEWWNGEVVGGVDDGSVRMWSARDGKQQLQVNLAEPGLVSDLKIVDNYCFIRNQSRVFKYDLRSPKDVLHRSSCIPTVYDSSNIAITGEHCLLSSAYNRKQNKKAALFACDVQCLAVTAVACLDNNGASFIAVDGQDVYVGNACGDMKVHSHQPCAILPKRDYTAGRHVFISPSTQEATVHVPNALPLFALPEEEVELLADPLNLRRLQTRLDPGRSARPDLPVQGEGHGGRLGSGPNATYMRQYLAELDARTAGRARGLYDREEDPREALLRYAEVAKNEPLFVDPAYRDTQPQPVYDYDALAKEAKRQKTRDDENEDI